MAAEIKLFSVMGDDSIVCQMIEGQINQWLLSQNYPAIVYAPTVGAFSDRGRTDLSAMIVVDHAVINTLQQVKSFNANGQDNIYISVQTDINNYLTNNSVTLQHQPASVAYVNAMNNTHNYCAFLVVA